MRRFLAIVVPSVLVQILCSCGSSYPLFLNTTLSEAQSLKQYCETQDIHSIEVQKADSLAVAARTKAKEGKENEAYWMVDAAAAYYRLAVAKHELGSAKVEVTELKRALAAAREQLNTYKEVLNELENVSNPR